MTSLAIREFRGIAPTLDPRVLNQQMAQSAVNCWLNNGSLHSFYDHNFIVTPTKSLASIKTAYRFGQGNPDESLYWWVFSDVVDVCKAQVAGDATERTIFVGDSNFGHPRVTNATLALTGGTNYPMASYRLGPPAPTAGPSVGVSGTGSGTTADYSVVFTYVTGDGEESQPSPPVDFTGQPGQTFTYGSFPGVPAGYNIQARRFYRAVVGASGTGAFALINTLADRPIAETTFADNVLDVDLGEEVPSTDWTTPPSGLRGIVNLPNGMMAGFDVDKPYDLCFSEPYVPHAWPKKYRKPMDYPIVGLGTFGDYLVVFTSGKTYVGLGTDPAAFTFRPSDLAEICASKRSIASTRTGVLYVSPRGIVRLGASNSGLLTEDLIDRKYWAALNPSSMHCYAYDGRYIGFYDNGTPGGFVFDPTDERSPFTLLNTTCTTAFNDPVRDSLYLAIGTAIREWEAAGTRMTFTWRSRIFETRSCTMGFGIVQANAYPVTFKLYGDGALVHTETVADNKAFRLGQMDKCRYWEIELSGQNQITACFVAQNSTELKALVASQ